MQRAHGGIDVGDDHGGERVSEGRLDGRLPSGVDAHEVEQRAEHSLAAGEVLGSGPSVGGVEGELQRLDPRIEVGERLGSVAAPL